SPGRIPSSIRFGSAQSLPKPRPILTTFGVTCWPSRDDSISEAPKHWRFSFGEPQPESLTDIQRAARYFYLQKSAYGGLVRRQSYAIHVIQRPNFSAARIEEVIEQ